MEWLRRLLDSNPASVIFVPSILSSFTFFGHLMSSLSDGKIDSKEFNQLIASANGIETLILFIIIYALSNNRLT